MGIVKTDLAHKGIVIAHVTTLAAQPVDDGKRRALADVVDVALVSHAQQQDARAFHRLAIVIQTIGNQLDDVLRHARIYFFGQTDKARIETMLPRFPRKIMRIERNAMAADAGAGIKRHKTE